MVSLASLGTFPRTHKVNISGLNEVLIAPGVELKYVDTKEQAADIFTKALGPQLWGAALDMLGIARTQVAVASGMVGPLAHQLLKRLDERGELFYNG